MFNHGTVVPPLSKILVMSINVDHIVVVQEFANVTDSSIAFDSLNSEEVTPFLIGIVDYRIRDHVV